MESVQVLPLRSGHIVSEQAAAGPGTEVWKVGACQAVVAVVTVLAIMSGWSLVEEVSWLGLVTAVVVLGNELTRRRCMTRVGGQHCHRRWEEECRRFEAGWRLNLFSLLVDLRDE